jgi:hypothetical protein
LVRDTARTLAPIAVTFFGVLAVAIAVAAAPIWTLGADRALAVRALTFLLLVLLVLLVAGRPFWPPATQLRLGTGLVSVSALLPVVVFIRSNAVLPLGPVWAVAVAAAVEESVFRVLLPHSIWAMLRRRNGTWILSWTAFVIAQIAFSVSHVATAAVQGRALVWNGFLTLFGGGCLLASVRILAGLPAAIGAHTVANLAISARAGQPGQNSILAVLALCSAALAHLALTVRTRADEPLHLPPLRSSGSSD